MKIIRFMEGFILGAILGALLSLLLTPESGEELRGKIKSEAGRMQAEIKAAAGERRTELEQQLAALRSPQKY